MNYTIRLTNSILGWMLVPSYQHPAGSEKILTHLYGEDWLTMKPSARAFMRGEPVETVKTHIREVCKDLGVSVSFCGNLKVPIIRLWWNPVESVEPDKVSVDLKWSLWSIDKGTWDTYAPGVWQQMEAAYNGGKPVTVSTEPRKEIRYGQVTISKGKAEGWFCTEWDEVESLAEVLNTTPDDAFWEMIPFSAQTMEPGKDWDFKVKARSFAALMKRIDHEEDQLLQADREEWESIKACF